MSPFFTEITEHVFFPEKNCVSVFCSSDTFCSLGTRFYLLFLKIVAQGAVAYSEPCQTSKTEYFTKIVNGF